MISSCPAEMPSYLEHRDSNSAKWGRRMLKMIFGLLMMGWMVVFGFRFGVGVVPLLLVIAAIVLLINFTVHRKAVN